MGVLVLVAIFIITLGLEEAPSHSQVHRARRAHTQAGSALAHHRKYHRYVKRGA